MAKTKKATGKRVKLSSIKMNPDNPRVIRDAPFYKLMNSLENFGEKMMPLRPIIVDENKVILGGNMRFKALKELGHIDVPENWIRSAKGLSDEDKKKFIVKDNVSFGDWNFELLSENWDESFLNEIGLSLPVFNEEIWAPNMDPATDHKDITQEDIDKAKAVLATAGKYKPEYIELTCPKCAHEYSVKEFS